MGHLNRNSFHLLKTRDGAFHAFQSFVRLMVIPGGVRIEQTRADKGGGFVGGKFNGYCAPRQAYC